MNKPFVWDWLVRITHWTVALLFFANYFVTKKGSETHELVGYCILAAIAVRLIWGLITHSPARLSAFLPSVSKAIEHLKEVKETRQDTHIGHNPAGAMMIWLMWTLLIVTGLTGWGTQVEMFDQFDWLGDVHETLANLTMTAVTIHVCAVIVMSHITRHSYLTGMLPFNRK